MSTPTNEGRGLFPIVPSGYDVQEADAYITFLLAEYNKAMERVAVLESTQSTTQGMDAAVAARVATQEAELRELRLRFSEISQQEDAVNERMRELSEKDFRLRQENIALQHKLEEAARSHNPTLQHATAIFATVLAEARQGGDQLIKDAQERAAQIISEAEAAAALVTAESDEKMQKAQEVVADSQKKFQEMFSFFQTVGQVDP
ncbi:MAG: hypothetical protein LBN05_02130 [Oscillospiraceae bacterium]|jgi:hypothetical protein|nr:hypothetical protein [Oscillospiraceae bacterium]